MKSSVFAALSNVRPTQLLDRDLAPKAEDARTRPDGPKVGWEAASGATRRLPVLGS